MIELAYYRGLSQSEIATELHIPIGTVKSRSHTALNDLRAVLSDREPDPTPAQPADIAPITSRPGEARQRAPDPAPFPTASA